VTQPAGAGTAAGVGATVDQLAAAIVALYAAAEQQLLASLAQAARHGFTDTAATAQIGMLGQMQRAAERVATALRLRSQPLTRRIASEAAQRGDAAAQALLRRIVAGNPALARVYLATGPVPGNVAAANAIATDLANRLDATTFRITRYADDAYRAATAEAATRLVLGRENLTPSTAQQLAWRELTRLGVTGYTDTAGRRWNLATYVETATRAAVQRAYNDAHDARMRTVGIDYFTVSHDGRPCPACKPWEGAVLGDQPGPATAPNAATGQPVAFTVKATLEQARAAGFQHPNCKHVLLPYLPGVTKTEAGGKWTAADEQAYAATQRLRALEREVRAGKREAAAALDDLARVRADRRVRAAQAKIRAHVDRADLNRRRRREQLHLRGR
jgi:hypothetical protein